MSRNHEPTVRCHKCGVRVPESESIRKQAKTGSINGIFGGTGTLQGFGATTYGVVDVCEECHREDLEREQFWWNFFLIGIFLFLVFIVLLSLLVMLSLRQ